MVKGYLKDRMLAWAVFLFFYAALFLIGYLYDIPMEKVFYIAEFTLAGAFLCFSGGCDEICRPVERTEGAGSR